MISYLTHERHQGNALWILRGRVLATRFDGIAVRPNRALNLHFRAIPRGMPFTEVPPRLASSDRIESKLSNVMPRGLTYGSRLSALQRFGAQELWEPPRSATDEGDRAVTYHHPHSPTPEPPLFQPPSRPHLTVCCQRAFQRPILNFISSKHISLMKEVADSVGTPSYEGRPNAM